ncbi:unnamed protein product [Caenorhabditis angaria]|uniref:SANTA domain-containing protein n=1 Tax=Caenorhabditis angaria TaxID=860376 RepID=A0A9P1MW07_9PELO|nr:unnamed protein product [Caenorhabditis angaria]
MNSGQILPVRIQDVLNMQNYQLRMWSLKFNGQDIRVEGFVMSDDDSMMRKVTSDALVRRMTATFLFDRSGSFFELIGPIDRGFQQKSGMKRELIDEFSEGFPENWGVLLSRCSSIIREQKSIDNTPPIQPQQKGPFVTLADDHTILETKKFEEKQPEKEFVDPNSTFRAPANCYLDAVTPIRWDKKTKASSIPNRVFEQTPQPNHVPLASSTPQPQNINRQQNTFAPPPHIDQPRFVIPDIEPVESNTEIAADIEHLFDEADDIKTPAALRQKRQSRDSRFARNQTISSRNYHDITSERNNTTRYTNDREKSGRKRPHFQSRSLSSDHGIPESRSRYYEDDMRRSRKDMNMTRASSVYQKSVNFEDDRYSRRGNGNKSRMVSSDYEYRDLDNKERYIREKLDRTRRQNHSSSSRKNSSYSETDKENSICWEKENEKLLNESLVAGRRSKSNGKFKEPKIKKEKKKAAPKRQKTPESEDEMDNENDDISPNVANRRPVRSCRNTPLSDPKPKRIVWLKRELEKLKRIVDMKKPSESEEDWREVHRLLQSRNSQVDWTGIKQIAIDKSIWKNTSNQQKPEDDNKFDEAEEEEEKRRKGVAAAVKEDKKLREQMVGSKNKDVLAESVESVENIEPADISADESFLASTPVVYTEAVRRKGGTRKSVVPAIVDDTPTRSINSSVDQTPKPDATTAKDMETTMKYVHQLASMTNRPGSRANRTNNTTIGAKNTSISIAKGAQKALKMVKKDVLEEEEEEDEETNSDSENESEEDDN